MKTDGEDCENDRKDAKDTKETKETKSGNCITGFKTGPQGLCDFLALFAPLR